MLFLAWGFGAASARAASQALDAVSCPSTTQCTAVDASGNEVTFNPTSLGSRNLTTVDGGQTLGSVSCPSTTQCTAVDGAGHEVTFDPTSGSVNSAGVATVDSGQILQAVSCPTTTQCTAVEQTGGHEVTFDPTSGTVSRHDNLGGTLTSLSCGSVGQCVAGTLDGHEVTFDPRISSAASHLVDSGHALEAISCPPVTTTQCTGVDDSGHEVTFDPTTGAIVGGASGVTTIDTGQVLTSVSCPSATQCTAVDYGGGGNEVTFDPTTRSLSGGGLKTIDSGQNLFSVSCPSLTQCTTVDGSGNEITFDPTSGTVTGSGQPDSAPSNNSPPTISGTDQQGQTLSEQHGSWSASPTSYSYQWFDCDGSGQNCTAIAGATNQTYALTGSDVGHTIRVQETASNANGSSGPATSGQTGVVSSPASNGTGGPGGGGAGTPPAGGTHTGSSGTVLFTVSRLRVIGGFLSVALNCSSRLACAGSFSITTKTKLGKKKKLRSVSCASASFRIKAGKKTTVRARVRSACMSLLHRAPGHHVTARFSSATTTGQRGTTKSITLTLQR